MRRIARGLSVSWIGQGTSVVSRLLEVPIVIAFWGTETYGIWLILNVIPTLLTASDFGLGSVTDRVMARELNEGLKDETLVTYQTSMTITLASSLLFSILTIAAFALGIAQPLIGLGGVPMHTTLAVVILLALRVVFQMIVRISQAGLFCVGEYPRGMLLSGVGDFLNLIAFFAAVLLGGGLVAAAFLQLIAAIALTVVMQRSVSRFAPWLTMGFAKTSKAKLRELAKPAFATFSLSISRSVNYTLPRVIVSAFGGPVAATIFHAHRQLARLINFMLLFGRPFQAEIALNYRKDGESDFTDLAERTVQLFVWISFASTIAVIALALLFFPYWTRGAFALDPVLFALLTATTLFEALGTSALLPVAGINRHGAVASTFLVVNAIAFLAAIPLTSAWGSRGMAFALLFVDAATCIRTYPVLAGIIQDKTSHVVRRAISPPFWVFRIASQTVASRLRQSNQT